MNFIYNVKIQKYKKQNPHKFIKLVFNKELTFILTRNYYFYRL